MQKVLLTWYGITDLRSALDFERGSTGPILGALKNGAYSTVVILGCTFQERLDACAEIDEAQFRNCLAGVDKSDYGKMNAFVQSFANTDLAHRHYIGWLQSNLKELGISTQIVFQRIMLCRLNDTEGIYEAANKAMSVIESQCPDAMVSLFLSPGTPVMAFVWALAALNYPRLKKRLISSSQPGKAPEAIKLPAEWLEWNGKRARQEETKEYDICFHLFGDQRLPSYWGMKQFACKRHVFITSKSYHPEVCLKPFADEAELKVIYVKPYDPENVRVQVLKYISTLEPNVRIAFNLTGGTKLMYAGAYAACRKVNGTPMYFNTQANAVVNLLTFEKERIRPINSVTPFFELNGNESRISHCGYWDEIPDIELPRRQELTELLVRRATQLSKNYKVLCEKSEPKSNKELLTPEGFVPFSMHGNGFSASIDMDAHVNLTVAGAPYSFAHFPGFAKYITGGWFEEYVYACLKPLEESGIIHDLRIGLEVSFSSRESGGDKTLQELDLTFTDGSRLYIVECKSGNVTTQHVMKLENIVRQYGGVGGRGLLISRFAPYDETVQKRLEDSKECRLICGRNITRLVENCLRVDQQLYLSV